MKYLKNVMLVVILLSAFTLPKSAAYAEIYLPKNTENCLITFEKIVEDSTGICFVPHGTGFIIEDTSTKNAFIITNRHVLSNRDSIVVRFNVVDSEGKQIHGTRRKIPLVIQDVNVWVAHSDTTIDLALIKMPIDLIHYCIQSSRIKNFDAVELGDQVLFLGFPLLSAALGDLNYPLVRSGVVSFKTYNNLENPTTKDIIVYRDHLLIDGVVMSGNSGSPVLSTPVKGQSKISLIGVLSSHLFKPEILSSPLAPAFDLKMKKDYNLGICIPAERIFELFVQYDSLEIMVTPTNDVEK